MKINEMVGLYVEARDTLAEMKREYEESIAPLKRNMEALEKKMLAEMNKVGVDSMRTDAGTVYKSVQASCTVADWDAYVNFAIEKNMLQLVNRSANKTAVAEYLESVGALPPGVNYTQFTVVNFRRS